MVTQWGSLGQPRVPPGTALRNKAVPGRRGWGRSPGPPGGDPHPSPAAAPISWGAHAAPRRVPGAGCTMHRGTGQGSARHQHHKAALLPPAAAAPAPPRGDAGTETPHGHRDPRASPPLSPGDAGPLPPALAARREAGWARAPRPDVTAPAHVPPAPCRAAAGPAHSHELMAQECTHGRRQTAARKQPPPHAGPGRSPPRRGAGGGHGACSVRPNGSSPGNCPPSRPAPGEPGSWGHWGEPTACASTGDGAVVPAALQSCSPCPWQRVAVPGLPAVTSSGDPPALVNQPFANAPLGHVPGPQPRPPHSGQHPCSRPGTMSDPPWGHGHPAPAPRAPPQRVAQLRRRGVAGTAVSGPPPGPGERLSPQAAITHRAWLFAELSAIFGEGQSVGSANTGRRRSSTPRWSPPSRGQPQAAREGATSPPTLQARVHARSHGPPAPTPGRSTHSSTHLTSERLGGPAAAPQQAGAHASRVHPPWVPRGTQPALAPPQTRAAFRVFSAAGSQPIAWPRSCTSHIPIAAPRKAAMSLMRGWEVPGLQLGAPLPRPPRAAPDWHPQAGGLGSPQAPALRTIPTVAPRARPGEVTPSLKASRPC